MKKIKFLTAILILLTGVIGFYFLNMRYKLIDLSTITVVTKGNLTKNKVKITKGFFTSDRKSDSVLFLGTATERIVFDGSQLGSLATDYGENDFLITYDDKYYFQFRHFILNSNHQHRYNFTFTEKHDTIFIESDIRGPDEMKFTGIMHLIADAGNLRWNEPIDGIRVVYNTINLSNSESSRILVNKKAKKPFNRLKYNRVVAFDYEGGQGAGVIQIITDGKLAKTVKQQRELTQAQVDDVTNFLGDNATYGSSTAFCFDPHLGIVFYDDTNIVAHVSICLECNYLISSEKIPATEARMIKTEYGSSYPAEGFSKTGRYKINKLCKELQFSNCSDTLNSMFDN